MIRGRLPRTKGRAHDQGEDTEFLEIEPGELTGVLAAPRWLRDLGLMSWLVVGVAAFLAGAVWLLALTQTIVLPVITAAIVAVVLSPVMASLERRGCGGGSARRSCSC